MIQLLKPKSEFNRNILTLMTGSTIANAIPVAISPILTRIYSPEDFGLLALFLAVTTIFGTIVNGRYELAIMLPKKDEDAINIVALGFIIMSLITLILFVIVIIFNEKIVHLLNNKDIGTWLYIVPLSIFLIGLFNLLNYFNNRKKHYKDIAKANIIKSITMVTFQIVVGYLREGAAGLISGQIASQMTANMKLLTNIIKNKLLLSKISKKKILQVAKRYKEFPKFSIAGALANKATGNLTNILISIFYNVSTLGFYSLVQRVLGVPSVLIGNSIGQVFFEEASKEKQLTGKAVKVFKSTVKKLFIIGAPSFGILFFIVEDLFAFVFGEEWRVAGGYARIMIPVFFIGFIVSTVSIVDSIFEKLFFYLCLQIGYLVSMTIALYLFKNYQFENLLIIIVIISCIHYLLHFIGLVFFVNGKG